MWLFRVSNTNDADTPCLDERQSVSFSAFMNTSCGISTRTGVFAASCPLSAFPDHLIQDLLGHLARVDSTREFQEPVAQGALAVINRREETRVADLLLIHFTRFFGLGKFFTAAVYTNPRKSGKACQTN